MSKRKAKKPPIDSSSVAERLDRALTERLVVRIRRWIPYSDRVDGFVVAVGGTWMVMASLNDLRLDGWEVLRIGDVQAVVVEPDEGCVEVRALKARSTWPPIDPELDLTDTRSLLSSIAARTRVAAVHLELDRSDSCYEGTILGVNDGGGAFLEMDTNAEWKRRPRLIDLDDITRLGFGDHYGTTLDLLAGAIPSV